MKKMMIAAAVATAIAGYAASAMAEEKAAAANGGMEKCYGVAKAGKNDCKGGAVASCAGHSAKDGEGFVVLPKGMCERIVGGMLTESK